MIDTYINALNAKCNDNGHYSFTTEKGRKYIKVITNRHGANGNSRSVHAFIDGEGRLYKAASWRAPAKKHRWNLNTDMDTVLHVMDTHGGYLYQDSTVA